MNMRQALIETKNALVRPYYYMRMWEPVWRLLNRDAIRRIERHPATVSELQSSLITKLTRDGIVVTHLDALFPNGGYLERFQSIARDCESRAVTNKKKTFLTQLYEYYRVIDLQDPFVRFALSQEVLDVVNGYIGMWAKLYYYTLGVTNPVAAGEVPRQSQRWHRDPEDRRMCKVFVYLNDVDETAGPFMYVRGSTRGNRWGHLFKQRPPHGYYPAEGDVEAKVSSEDILACTGRAGTVIFADTSGLHKGGYATEKPRVMSTTGFVTQASPRGVFYRRGEEFLRHYSTYNPAAQFALENKKIAGRRWQY